MDVSDKQVYCKAAALAANAKSCILENKSPLLIVIATFLGFGIGLSLRTLDLSPATINIVGFPGVLMLRCFSMILVPLLCCSIILGISSIGMDTSNKMAALTMAFFFGLSTSCAIIGVLGGFLIPDLEMTENTQSEIDTTRKGSIGDSIMDLLRNAIPNNIIQATFMQEYTDTSPHVNGSAEASAVQYKFGVNYMGLLLFCVLCGSGMAHLGSETSNLRNLLHEVNIVVLKILEGFAKFIPVAMFFWMFQEGLLVKSPGLIFTQLGQYVGISLLLLGMHQLVILPVIYVLIVRESPLTFHKNLLPALFTAFGTASSALTLPVTMRCMEDANSVHRTVTRFVLPLGMVVHMNGGTLYHATSAIFVARLEKGEITVPDSFMIGLMSFLLLVAAPGMPSSGSPILLMTLLASIGIDNPKHMAVVLVVDWLMERVRTSSNVLGDCYVAAYVEKLCWRQLQPEPKLSLPRRRSSIDEESELV